MKHHSFSRSRVRIVVGGALVVAFVAVFGFNFSSTAAPHGEKEHVREALMQSAAGFEKGDMAVLNKVWANDESVTVFESGHANYGWADYRDHHLMPEMKEMKNTKHTPSDSKGEAGRDDCMGNFQIHRFCRRGSPPRRGQRTRDGGIGKARRSLADSPLAFKRPAPCSCASSIAREELVR